MKKIVAFLSFVILLVSLTVSHVQAASVTLAWDISPDPTVIGYNVYYGNSTRNYTNSVNAGTNTSCVVSNLTLGGTYYFAATAVANNGLESDFSNEVSYNVPPSFYPTIVSQPTSRAVNKGSNTTFTVTATTIVGTNAYQWRFNGTNLVGATTTSLTLTNIQATNAGNYLVVVANGYNAVTSQMAVLSVQLPPTSVVNFRVLAISPSN